MFCTLRSSLAPRSAPLTCSVVHSAPLLLFNSHGCLRYHSLCSFRLSPVHAPESPVPLSLLHILQWFLSGLSTQLLQSDTGVPHFALDPLTHRCLLSLSPAEPCPPRHIPPPPDSGWEALRPAAPNPPPPTPHPFLERMLATVICFPGL